MRKIRCSGAWARNGLQNLVTLRQEDWPCPGTKAWPSRREAEERRLCRHLGSAQATQTAPVIASDCKRWPSISLQGMESITREAVDKPRSMQSFILPVFFYFVLHGKMFTKG